MPRLYQWISQVVVQKVLVLKYLIEIEVPQSLRSHFLLVLASILRPASNMKRTPHAFGSRQQKEDSPVYDLFAQKIHKLYGDLVELRESGSQFGKGEIIEQDSRKAKGMFGSKSRCWLRFTQRVSRKGQ